MTSSRTCCSLSLDLDNKWSYMKTHGDPEWESLPSYLDLVVPRVLDLLGRLEWRITFFVVGQDAALDVNRAALAAISNAGHEIGNHSFHHEPWLHLYSRDRTEDEIARAEDAIGDVTGQRTIGFRGPGYSLSRATLEILHARGYRYDASTLPTYLGPLARAYYFLTSNLSREEKQQRKALFGSLSDGLQPLRPYLWRLADDRLLEIPVTTMPLAKVPIHFSYLLYIGTYSRWLARLYFRTALSLCRTTRTQPSLLLHPLDFLGGDDVSELAFFPAMGVSGAQKLDRITEFLEMLGKRFQVLPMAEHAKRLLEPGDLPSRRWSRAEHPGLGRRT
jgi:peptidoglycan/xylan/chitin deacetylase (PgdA/CDA1 family)